MKTLGSRGPSLTEKRGPAPANGTREGRVDGRNLESLCRPGNLSRKTTRLFLPTPR